MEKSITVNSFILSVVRIFLSFDFTKGDPLKDLWLKISNKLKLYNKKD